MKNLSIAKKYVLTATAAIMCIWAVGVSSAPSTPPDNNQYELVDTSSATSTKEGSLTVSFVGGNFLWSGDALSVGSSGYLPSDIKAYVHGNIGANEYCNELGQKCVKVSGGLGWNIDKYDYQSPWTRIGENVTQPFTFSPAINSLNTMIYIEASALADGSNPHQRFYGGDSTSATVARGFYWLNKHANGVSIKNGHGGGSTVLYFRVTAWNLDNGNPPATIISTDVNIYATTTAIATFKGACPTAQGWQPFVPAQGKFVMSADTAVGVTGGNANITLAANQIPAHRHTYDRIISDSTEIYKGENEPAVPPTGAVPSFTTGTSGGTKGSFNIMPPYYALTYCKYVGI